MGIKNKITGGAAEKLFYSFPLLSKLKHFLKNKKNPVLPSSLRLSVPPAVFSPLIHIDSLMFSLCVHEEVYLKKDALQGRSKSAIGSEFICLSTHSWDRFFNISIFLFDCYMTSVVSCTIIGLFSLILDWSGFVFKSNLKLVLSSKCEWSDIMQCTQLNPILKNRWCV